MPLAIVRGVSPRFAECELTHIERESIDVDVARAQHTEYVAALRGLGCDVLELPAEPDLPDSVFVEDAAVVLPEAAVITRPGAASRRPETTSIAQALRPHRELVHIQAPATLDGGDVLVLGKTIYVGLSTRSGTEAIAQLQELLRRFGYSVHGVGLTDCLHLKSAVTALGPDVLLVNRRWVEPESFDGCELVDIHPDEPFAANILMIGGRGLYPTAFPRTAEILQRRGIELTTLDLSEIAKAEGAVTCCSLIIGEQDFGSLG